MATTEDNIYDEPPTTDTASAALTTLFESGPEYSGLDIPIDPSLDATGGSGGGETAAATLEAAAEAQPSADGSPAGSKAATPPGAGDGADSNNNDPAQAGSKRKATSRINMLPRGGACEFCKRRKLKCTAEQPQCAACARTGRECVYSQKQQRSRVRVLEDKLLELERRLDQERQANATHDGASSGTDPSPTSHNLPPGPLNLGWVNNAPGVPTVPNDIATMSATHPPTLQFVGTDPLHASSGVELFLGLETDAFTLANVSSVPKNREPDLMTLADAAAGDANGITSWPWEGMSPAAVVAEMAKAVVENHKGMGEKIILHLLQNVNRTPQIHPHWMANPLSFIERLTGVKGQPPHPALVAALLPTIMFLSPSPTLNNRDTVAAATDALIPASRQLAQHALSCLDPRVLDIVAAALLRAVALSAIGRFVDSWTESANAVSLVWGVGIGKLGHVMEEFLPLEQRSADRATRHEYERRLRDIRGKSQITSYPSDIADCVERSRLLWSIYLFDRISGLGWNWPSLMDYSEITTPLPHDSYDTAADIKDKTTLEDFMSGRVGTKRGESVLSLQVKTYTILNEASRLLDKDQAIATPDKTAHLLRISKQHMAMLPPFSPTTREESIQKTDLADVWIGMYSCLMLLYGKEEVDAPSAAEASEALNKGIDASFKMCECIERAIAAGDTELSGASMPPAIAWYISGRVMHHYAKRIEAQDPTRAELIRSKLRFLIQMSRKITNNLRLSEVYAQMLHNITLDSEVLLGEYERPDNTEFVPTPIVTPM